MNSSCGSKAQTQHIFKDKLGSAILHVVNQYGWKSIGLVEYRQECALVMDGIREAIARSSNTTIILDIQLRNDSDQDIQRALEQVKRGARGVVLC